MTVSLDLLPLDFDPTVDARFTQGVTGRIPSRPGKSEERFACYFEPKGEPGVVVVLGQPPNRRAYLLTMAGVTAAAVDAEAGAAVLAPFLTA